MPRAASPSIPEKEFLLASLSQGLRIDGRVPLQPRTPELSFGPELGWVECSMGKTRYGAASTCEHNCFFFTYWTCRVIAQIDAKMVKPTPERPYEGMLVIHSEISPMAAVEYEPGRASDEEVVITRMLDKVLRRSDAVDKESLCVLAGQRVWSLRLTLHFLADAGNMLDCACLAGIVALRHFRRPEVEVIGEEVIVHSPEARAPLPLSMHHTPFCLTFAFFTTPATASDSAASSSSIIAVLDPSQLEETLAEGTLSVALNAQREICVLQKAGGVPLEADEILKFVAVAIRQVKELDKMVEDALAEDWKNRKVEVR